MGHRTILTWLAHEFGCEWVFPLAHVVKFRQASGSLSYYCVKKYNTKFRIPVILGGLHAVPVVHVPRGHGWIDRTTERIQEQAGMKNTKLHKKALTNPAERADIAPAPSTSVCWQAATV